MASVTFSSRDFNQDTGRAKKAAKKGPVFITDRGRPSYVLLSIEDYRSITGPQTNIVELLAMSGADQVDFEPPRLSEKLFRTADLS